jgi:hypothetical protein
LAGRSPLTYTVYADRGPFSQVPPLGVQVVGRLVSVVSRLVSDLAPLPISRSRNSIVPVLLDGARVAIQ